MDENIIKRARWTAIVFGSLASLTLIAFVFAFVQQAEAKKQAAWAIECERKSVELIKQLETKNGEVLEQLDRAQAALQATEEMKVRTESNSTKK